MRTQQIFLLIGVFLFILIVSFIGYYFLIKYIAIDWNEGASIGNSFGVLSAFFNALAFGGVIFTLFLQNKAITQNEENTNISKDQFERRINQLEQQLNVQAISTLIAVYEKKLLKEELENSNNPSWIIDIKIQIAELTKELETYKTINKNVFIK